MKRNRETEVPEEHATLVEMPKNRIGARVSHHVQRYIDSKLWDRCFLWKFYKEPIKLMSRCLGTDELPEEAAEANSEIPDNLNDLAIEMAEEISEDAFRIPQERYTAVPEKPDDVMHWKYVVSFYVLEWSVKKKKFVPVRMPKHGKYGYLSYWREGELGRLNMDRVKKEEKWDVFEFIKQVRDADKEAAQFRSANGLTGMTSLGEELYRTIPGESVLKAHKVVEAASVYYNEPITADDPRVVEYTKKYLSGQPAPESWFIDGQGDHCGFFIDSDALPAVVLPKHVKQGLGLRDFPQPIMEIDPGVNSLNIW